MSGKRRAAYVRGLRAENIAAIYLRCKGYRILARRYLGGGGEADIIARRGAVIAFVEVKARRTFELGHYSLTHEKRKHMSRAARHWLSRYPGAEHLTWRGDALLLSPWRWPKHLPNAIELIID